MNEPDFEWLMIGAGHCKMHFTCNRHQRKQSGYGSYKRELNTKGHLAVGVHGMPVRVIITPGSDADC